MAKVKRQARSDETRAAIMEAGTYLFGVKGFRETGIREIAERAAVNPALISYHFGGKAGLYDTILANAVEAAKEALALEAAGQSLEERLVRGFARALSARPHLPAVILREQLDPDRLLDPATGNILRQFMTLTEKTLDALPLDEEARGWDPQIVHLCVVGPLIHFLVSTPMREQVAAKLDRPLSLPGLDEFVAVQSRMLHRALTASNVDGRP